DGVAVVADMTVTFGALKTGLVCGEGAIRAGDLRLVDIGLGPYLAESPSRVLEAADVAELVPPPGPTDDKYTRGVVGVIAGSPQYGGAGVLATGAALHGGAGMVRYLGLAPEQIRARYPEVVVHAVSGRAAIRPRDVQVQSWVIGPGLGTGPDAAALLAEVLAVEVPVIVDADAITVLAREPGMLHGRTAPTVLTPHDREFNRLPTDLDADRVGSARRAAAELGVILLLKGDATVVAGPDGSVYVNRTGTPWLGTAGSGDVLSGLIGALLARGLHATLAAAAGAYLHGVSGQLAASAGPPTASDVLASLRAALHAVRR
ncbi:MAG TPA: NAD(P)H-hydrate dehydratase, partial [Jatrophihabitantaceae bacterium]|nr:NAD(P)H-hydrate dehydratase [Jatrophihabitantaceae bacterium]